MRITHYDLFAGIGGFSLALDNVFNDYEREHIFCEWESFPTAVLKKHWPDGTYYGDIADLVADTSRSRTRLEEQNTNNKRRNTSDKSKREVVRQGYRETNAERIATGYRPLIVLTGGFPCQPFSHAGRRNGTADDRYKWPDMFAVIKNVQPDWVIAENVRGLVTWNEGMVLEQVCTDLESEGYEVQPIIIPAVAVNAPHRRDRVWIIAHAINGGQGRKEREITATQDRIQEIDRTENSATREPERADSDREIVRPFADSESERDRRSASEKCGTQERIVEQSEQKGSEIRSEGAGRSGDASDAESERIQGERIPIQQGRSQQKSANVDWTREWREVALATCHDGVDDGLSYDMDGVTISGGRHRKDRLKACGNAIVPQVAMEIFKAIRTTI